MAKDLKIKIKNTQLAKAVELGQLKAKLSGKEAKETAKAKKEGAQEAEAPPALSTDEPKEAAGRRIRAKSKSSFVKEEPLPLETSEGQAALSSDQEEKIESPLSEADKENSLKEEPSVESSSQTSQGPEGTVDVKALKPSAKTASEVDSNQGTERGSREAPSSAPTGEAKPVDSKLASQKATTPPPSGKQGAVSLSKTTSATGEKKTLEGEASKKEAQKGKKVREFKDLKPARRGKERSFDARDRQGLSEDDERWRKKRAFKMGTQEREEPIVRPTKLKIHLPITVKGLAAEMKLKSSEIVQILFLQGMTYTLNDILDDETTVQFIGNEFGCDIKIDTAEAERIQITTQSVREEIATTNPARLLSRPPVVAFMGHVDHGKTSLIDAIRKSNIAAGEAGAITQHIGAFKCKTAVGEITILDTPGHEAFSAMRARGAEVTDIVVLVVAGDEGLREQTLEAIEHAKAAKVTIVVALNKCDKPTFNPETVYRELAERELLPEVWGGNVITVNTSATTGEGIPKLLEMLALQAEVLELKANPEARARGTVLESELHKGLGSVATVLVQNGTLALGDALVFERHWGRVKTMHDEHKQALEQAGPSTPVAITGLSGIPKAGDPFIVVVSEKEARHIIESREVGREERLLQQKKPSFDQLMQKGNETKKILKLILRADVQGSVEALKTSILKIQSTKAAADVIFSGVGEISESDIELAGASNAAIIGFHTSIESHADALIKERGVAVHLFDIIYHAVEAVKTLMRDSLDKIEEEKDAGTAQVKALFKSSQTGLIAGCLVTEGTINRSHRVRLVRDGNVIWKGGIASLKRVKEDVREVKKGFECGILLDRFSAIQEGDVIQAYEIIYLTQEL